MLCLGFTMSDPLCFPLFAARFVTPDQKYVVDNTPHTPTPFKNALEKYGPIGPLVSIGQVSLLPMAEMQRTQTGCGVVCSGAVSELPVP